MCVCVYFREALNCLINKKIHIVSDHWVSDRLFTYSFIMVYKYTRESIEFGVDLFDHVEDVTHQETGHALVEGGHWCVHSSRFIVR